MLWLEVALLPLCTHKAYSLWTWEMQVEWVPDANPRYTEELLQWAKGSEFQMLLCVHWLISLATRKRENLKVFLFQEMEKPIANYK